MPKIRVLVVDDHTLFRQGITGLLGSQPDIDVVGQAGSGTDALTAMGTTSPDVVLMDISMPGTTGLSATAEIKARFPETNVVVLTIHDRQDYLYRALRAGASGYVLKGADIRELLEAIRVTARGGVYLYPAATKALVIDYLRRSSKGEGGTGTDGLSDREREILQLIAQGRTTPEIAAELTISPHTVQTHRDHIMTKLDLHSKAALIKYAIANGLIEL